MIDQSSAIEILTALGFAVFELRGDGRFHPLGPAPEWFRRVCPQASTTRSGVPLDDWSAYLANFLVDAREFWESGQPGPLRSGPWIQPDRAGFEQGLEASAIHVNQRRILILEELGETFTERRAALQLAREQGLAYERLEGRVQSLATEKERLAARTSEVERLNQLKSEFLASMSHELRTPLNAILGFSSLLAEERPGPLNEKQKAYLNHVSRGADHLLALINDILDLSKIEAGVEQLHHESFLFDEASADLLSSIRPLAEEKRVRVDVARSGDLPVYADCIRFKQILYNLLSNAIKFSPPGGLVGVCAASKGNELTVEVRDSGVGIPPEERQAIFEKFHQVGITAKGVREGTGLGLAITKRLVELHGGRIWVEENSPSGSRFLFTLPADRLADVPTAEVPWQEQPRSLNTSSLTTSKLHLAIVEDDAASRALLTAMLEDRYLITPYETGNEALAGFRQSRPDLVLLDISLPEMDGTEVLRRMRSESTLCDIPAIAVSAHALKGDREKFESAGFDAYHSKPITDSHRLVQVIDELIASRNNLTRRP